MTPQQALQRVLEGLRDDLVDYGRLRELLDAQFTAALRHRADEVRGVVAQVLEVTARLERRRSERVDLVRRLLAGERDGVRPSMQALSVRLPPSIRGNFDACCTALEKLLRECKRLNRRNCHVLTAQHDMMRQALEPNACTYAPA
jgi:flagella synthesis protein FlgN